MSGPEWVPRLREISRNLYGKKLKQNVTSTSKYLCKKEDERHHFSRMIRCNPTEGKGETSKGGHTGTPTADSEQETAGNTGRAPKHEGAPSSSRGLGDLSEGQMDQGLKNCQCVKGLLR